MTTRPSHACGTIRGVIAAMTLSMLLAACGGGGTDAAVDDAAAVAGTGGTASAQSIWHDGTAPTVAITGHTGDGTATAVLSGTAVDNIRLTSMSWTNSAGTKGTATLTLNPSSYNHGTWTAAVPLAAGSNNIVVTALDGQGNAGTAALTVAGASAAPQTLSVAATGSGVVASTPTGIDCSGVSAPGCVASFPLATLVTLNATPANGATFAGWTGACTGTGACSVAMSAAKQVAATFNTASAPGSTAPVLSFIDAVSGPVTGGENNLGAYLSLFGNNFGAASGLGTTTKVYIGGVEVANYRFLGAAKVGGKLGLQQLTVQVGALGKPVAGVALPVKVVVGGVASNTNYTFTPNPGRVLFVSLTGNDATAVANDITHPWRHLQTSSNGGIGAIIQAGDHVIIRGGAWNDQGFDTAWFRFRYPQQEGTAPTGAAVSGWIHFTAYPGPVNGNAIESVHYTTPANAKGGFQGANSAYYATTGDYVSISNLQLDVDANATSDAAPINLQYSAGPWRVVNNELGPWPAAIHSLAAGVSGHGNGTVVLGNHIHDIACTGALENHGIYADSGASNWDIGYNWIHDITGGNLLQFYDNVGLAGQSYVGFPPNWPGFTGMKVHHNWMENSGKYGLNLADGIVSGQIWNNVVKGATYSGLRINTISQAMDFTIAFNTFQDNDRVVSGSGNGQVLNTWGNYGPTGTIRIYDNILAAGPDTVKTSAWYVNTGSSDAYLDFKRNLYWDNGDGWGTFSRDPLALFGNPLFTSLSTSDLTLASGSPAINTGTQAIPFSITDDMTRMISRPQGGVNDIGAYEKLQ